MEAFRSPVSSVMSWNIVKYYIPLMPRIGSIYTSANRAEVRLRNLNVNGPTLDEHQKRCAKLEGKYVLPANEQPHFYFGTLFRMSFWVSATLYEPSLQWIRLAIENSDVIIAAPSPLVYGCFIAYIANIPSFRLDSLTHSRIQTLESS